MKASISLNVFVSRDRSRLTPRPYVARITGWTPDGLCRAFLKGQRDHRYSNGVGSRGARDFYVLEYGQLYELREVHNWSTFTRYWAVVNQSGEVQKLTIQEAIEHAKKLS